MLDDAKHKLKYANDRVRSARNALDTAKQHLEGVINACRPGTLALQRSKTLFTSLRIQEISFRTSLSVANGGVFKVNVKAVILGQQKSFSIHFNIRNPIELIKYLANQLDGGLFNFLKS